MGELWATIFLCAPVFLIIYYGLLVNNNIPSEINY